MVSRLLADKANESGVRRAILLLFRSTVFNEVGNGNENNCFVVLVMRLFDKSIVDSNELDANTLNICAADLSVNAL